MRSAFQCRLRRPNRTTYVLMLSSRNLCKLINWLFSSSPEQPKGNALCPRKNGFFAHPDAAVCNIFYNCIEGEANEISCTAGLHFDEYSGTCVWPSEDGRQGCNPGVNSNYCVYYEILHAGLFWYLPYRTTQGWIHLPEGAQAWSSRPVCCASQIRSPVRLPAVLRLPERRGATWLGMPSRRGIQRGNRTLRCTRKRSRMVRCNGWYGKVNVNLHKLYFLAVRTGIKTVMRRNATRLLSNL